jgi:SsrA-binding protein
MAVEIKNKKAGFTYFLTDEFTAGIQLVGSEIKSIRAGKASITEGYCRFYDGEFFVDNMYIAEYANAGYSGHEPRRRRKLLLTKNELKKLEKKLKDSGVTVVPTLMFISPSGYAKLKIAVAKGKKLHDKRDAVKSKDLQRDLDRMEFD